MRTQISVGLASALATLALLSGVASAETLTISPAREITLVSLGAIVFESNIGVHVDCNMTLSGSLTTGSFTDTRGTTIGSITSSTISGCTGGRASALVEAGTPWSIAYEAVDGSFPQDVTGYQLTIVGARLLVEAGLASCLYTADLGVDGPTTYSELGEANEDIVSRTGLVTLQEERQSVSSVVRLAGLFCPTEPTVLGTFGLEPQQSITQAETALQLGLPTNITFTRLNEIRTITLRNEHPRRTEQLEASRPVYTREGDRTAFRVEGGTCRVSTVLQPAGAGGGETCTIFVRFVGPRPASSRLAVDLSTVFNNPAVQGNLIG